MNVNQSLLNMTIPTKLNTWYNKLIEAIKKYHEIDNKSIIIDPIQKKDIPLLQ